MNGKHLFLTSAGLTDKMKEKFFDIIGKCPKDVKVLYIPSIPHSTMKEHPDIVKFCHFSAYVRTRSAGILRGLTPWHTDFGTKI